MVDSQLLIKINKIDPKWLHLTQSEVNAMYTLKKHQANLKENFS